MTSSPMPLTDCRFCSLVSQANGDDPIGSAPVADHWLLIEIPQPWSHQLFVDNSQFQSLFAQIRKLIRQGVKLRPIAIAPDQTYSRSGYRRIIYYRRPPGFFSAFEPQEYLVPETAVPDLTQALLQQIQQQPNLLERFSSDRQDHPLKRDLLVCTHGNVDVACARFGFPIYDQLRKSYASDLLRVWRCSHFGGHQYAPTLVDLPSGRFWGHLAPELLEGLVSHQGEFAALYRHYRGWAGLAKFEQIVEREVWMQEGWDWLTYQKQGHILQLGESWLKRWLRRLSQGLPLPLLQRQLEHSAQDARWAIVQLNYVSPDGKSRGSYQARVEVSGQIQTAIRSSNPISLVPINQYRVTALKKLV